MKIVITGATGFVCSVLINKLSEEEDTTIYGIQRGGSRCTDNYQSIVADLSSSGWTKKLPKSADVVISFAQSNHYREFPEGAQDMFAVNVHATFELLEWSRSAGVNKFIFASSGAVYKPSKELHKEADFCIPSSMYTASKLSAEHLIQQYESFFETTICRLFTPYGPGQKNKLIPDMIERVKNKKPIILAGGEGLYLTPIHIDNLCEAVLALIRQKPSKENRIINIAGNKVISLSQIVKVIGECFNIDPIIENTDEPTKYICGDSEKISKFINNWKNILNPEYFLSP